MKPCCKQTLRVLAEAMNKVLTPKEIENLKWACNPLEEFLKVLREPKS